MIYNIQGNAQELYAHTMQFYVKNLNIFGFGVPGDSGFW